MADSREIVKALIQHDYKSYVSLTNTGWKHSKFHDYLCDTVQEFVERETDKAYEIMIISTPPQHGKSMTITETLPSWYLLKHPTRKVIEVSYSEDFAQKFGLKNKSKIEEYGEIFGTGLSKDKNTANEFWMAGNNGQMISRGVTGGVTGNPANLFIIDDPIKTQQEADSETTREHLWDEWNSSYKSRLAPNAKVIVIMTRWHEDDLAGRMIENEPNVTVVNLPCEAEEDDVLGRKVGEALCPEIGKGDKWLADFKKGYLSKSGSRTWNALFQGRPVSAQGNLLQREWWKYYDTLPELNTLIMSVDAAFKDGKDNDFVAIQIWGKRDSEFYLVDAVKKHLDMPKTVKEILRLKGMYPTVDRILIEDKANGTSVIQVLRRQIHGIVPITPQGGKVSRVNAVSGAIESGNVFLPKKKPFTEDFVNECSAFPNGKHDDQVDAMSQALNRLIYWKNGKPSVPTSDNKLIQFNLAKKSASSAIGKGESINVI